MLKSLFLLLCGALYGYSATKTYTQVAPYHNPTAYAASYDSATAAALDYNPNSNLQSRVGFDESGGGHYYYVTELSFNTADLAGLPVSSAAVTIRPYGSVQNNAACTLNGEWYTGADDMASLWVKVVGTSAFSVPLTSFVVGTPSTITLSGADASLNKNGVTKIRLGVSCTNPASVNYAYVNLGYLTTTPASLSVDALFPNNTPIALSSWGLVTNVNYGTWATVIAMFRDADGYADINDSRILLSYGVSDIRACAILIKPNSNYYQLLNDAGTAWGEPHYMGAADYAENGQCKVDSRYSTLSNAGISSTASLRLMLKPGFFTAPQTGVIRDYLCVNDLAGATSGWSSAYTVTNLRSGPKLIVASQR